MECFKTIELERNYITNMEKIIPLLQKSYQKKRISIRIEPDKYQTFISASMPQPKTREGVERNSQLLKNCVDAIGKTLFY